MAKKKSTTSSTSKQEGSGKKAPVSSLETMQHFTYEGKEWAKRRLHAGGVTCLSVKGNELLTLDPDTPVVPK